MPGAQRPRPHRRGRPEVNVEILHGGWEGNEYDHYEDDFHEDEQLEATMTMVGVARTTTTRTTSTGTKPLEDDSDDGGRLEDDHHEDDSLKNDTGRTTCGRRPSTATPVEDSNELTERLDLDKVDGELAATARRGAARRQRRDQRRGQRRAQ